MPRPLSLVIAGAIISVTVIALRLAPTRGSNPCGIPENSLVKQMTVQEAEAVELRRANRHLVTPDGRRASSTVPFGRLDQEWQELKSQLRGGGALWSFDALGTEMRAAGYVIVRGGSLEQCIVTTTRSH